MYTSNILFDVIHDDMLHIIKSFLIICNIVGQYKIKSIVYENINKQFTEKTTEICIFNEGQTN
jgi:hypothetical protein